MSNGKPIINGNFYKFVDGIAKIGVAVCVCWLSWTSSSIVSLREHQAHQEGKIDTLQIMSDHRASETSSFRDEVRKNQKDQLTELIGLRILITRIEERVDKAAKELEKQQK